MPISYSYSLRFIIISIIASIALFGATFFVANAQETNFSGEAAIGVGGGGVQVDAQAFAQADTQATQFAALDENVKSQDLGVGDPNVLPGSPLYGLKNAARGFRSFLTRDPAKKAELRMEFANEKLIEAKKLSDQGKDNETVKKAIGNYEKEIGKVKSEVEKLKQTPATQQKMEGVVEKALDNQIKHNKIFGKLMKEKTDMAPELESKKQEMMKNFVGSVAGMVEPETFQKKFEEAFQNQKGSVFKNFKHVEILEEVKDFVPEQAKGAIENAIKQSSKLFQEEFQQTSEDQRKIFNKYMEKIGGNEVRHLEALDSLSSFAEIEADMFGEMEKAREKARKRVEERMKNTKDETQKQVFIAHLENGRMEDARIVKELEGNLAPETITGVLDIKHKFEEKMRAKFENAQSTGDLSSFFGEIEDRPDVQMLSVMKDMEQLIPVDKKGFFEEMKKKAMTEMGKNIDQARQFGRAEDQMRQMAGFNPEDMQVMQDFQGEFGGQFAFFEDMNRAQAGKINQRFQHMREFASDAQFAPQAGAEGSRTQTAPFGEFRSEDFFDKAEEFRLRVEGDSQIQGQIQQFAPQMFQQFNSFDRQRNEHGFDQSKVDGKIDDANDMVAKLEALVSNSTEGTPGLEDARRALEDAKRFQQSAGSAFDSGKSGEAYGQGTSAFKHAVNGIRKLENAGFEQERTRYFDARDQVRQKFEGEGIAPQQVNFDQFIDFKPPSFEQFSKPEFFGNQSQSFRGAPQQGRPDDKTSTGSEQRPGETGRFQPDQGFVCAQVMTPAKHISSGTCKTFNNACLPPGWKADPSCEGQTGQTGTEQGRFPEQKPVEHQINFDAIEQFRQKFDEQRLQQPSQQPFRQPFQPFPGPTGREQLPPGPTPLGEPIREPFPTHQSFPTPFPTYKEPSPSPTIGTTITPFPTHQQPSPTPYPTYKEPSPTPAPTYQQPSPTPFPTIQPTHSPTPYPTISATVSPTPYPTYQQVSPTPYPTYKESTPTPAPTYQQPSPTPTPTPTYQQISPTPTPVPTYQQPSPTPYPTISATVSPTPYPTYQQVSPTPYPTYQQPTSGGSIFDVFKRLRR